MTFFLKFAIVVSLGCIMTSCQRKKPAIIQAMDDAQSWTKEFEKQYPNPIPPSIKSPHLGQTGNVGITKNLQFILRNFPSEKLPELQTFVEGRLKSQGLESVTILAFVPSVRHPGHDFVESMTLKFYADGRIEDSRVSGDLAEIPELNINGRPIHPDQKKSVETPLK
jgi:hypothetical protein